MMRTHARLSGVVLLALGCLLGAGCNSEPGLDASKADPTVAREPLQSKSLELSEDWVPPQPTRTAAATPKERVEPPTTYGVASRAVGLIATDAELRALALFSEPLVPVPGRSSPRETWALRSALNAYQSAADVEQTAPLQRFVEDYPDSRWAPSLLLNLGTIAYHTGRFQEALGYWHRAWELAKAGSDTVSQQIANQAVAEYAKMNARVGRVEELDRVFAETQGRTFMGDARVKLESALEGRWVMEHRPGVAFRCGPYALANIAPLLDKEAAAKTADFLQTVQSPRTGFSLTEVAKMSEELGLELQMARREPGSSVILPAVVHWKVGHYGALLRELNGKYLLEDPTFGNQTWMSQAALDQEASGYFLVPAGPLPAGWRQATSEEAATIYGKGHSGSTLPSETGADDHQSGGDCGGGNLAMATYGFHTLLASLHVVDTPVGYPTAIGPEVRLQVAYNQREASQPASITFTNFGPQWVSNWVSYLEDNTSSPGANVTLRKRGGGSETHSGFNATTQTYALEPKSASQLSMLSPNTYKKVHPDGSEEYYEHYIGTTGTQRKVFLSRVVDAQGNQVSLEYDDTYPARLNRIIDATGLPTVFAYEYPDQPYLVTRVEDPFGRAATFTYANAASALRLQSIEDVYGIVSSFEYSSAGEMVAMSTPYGRTTFSLSPLKIGASYDLIRFIEATDPNGNKERIEYNLSSSKTGVSGTLEQPYPDSSLVRYTTGDNDDRNSFYWDKQRMKVAPGDYLKAHRYHWVQPSGADVAMSILESEKPPLEGRIFYNYPGQTSSYIQGTLASPSVVARVVQDAQGVNATQAYRYQYSSTGRLVKVTDPLGRETVTEYAANGVDVVQVKQKTGDASGVPVWSTLTSYAYEPGAPAHLPTAITDGAGRTTRFTYTATGQVAAVQNANGGVATFAYETTPGAPGFGRLVSISGAVPGGARSFTYDGFGRIRTATDSEGYTLTYDYDSLDRARVITYPDGSFEQFEYADHSLVAYRDREGHWTRHQYNRLRQRVLTRDAQQRVVQLQWCRCGALGRLVDGKGNITAWERDEQGRVKKKTYPDGSTAAFEYDFSGRLVRQVDPMGLIKTYGYTLDDRLSKVDYSDAATADVTLGYDTWFDRLTSRTDGAGTTAYGYHPFDGATPGAGQLAFVDGPFPDDTVKYTYDALGRRQKLEIVDDATRAVASYSQTLSFDSLGRVQQVANGLGAFAYTYVGQSDRPSLVAYPNGMQVAFGYRDAAGDFQLSQIKNLAAGPDPKGVISQFDYTYDQDGQRDSWAISRAQASATTWTFGYDAAHQLTQAELRDASQTVLESERYGYDKAGNRVQVVTPGAAPANYVTNALNQLVSERGFGPTRFAGRVDEPATVTVNGQPAQVRSTQGGPPYSFEAEVDLPEGTSTVEVTARDGRDNARTQTYQVTTEGTRVLYEYDPNGNLRFERSPSGTVLREYRWDQANRLARIVEGPRETAFAYDGASRRVRSTQLDNGVVTKDSLFIWCGQDICQRRSGATVERNYFPHGFSDASGGRFYTRDHLGSIWEVVASNGTTVESRLRYSPWGKVQEETGTGLTDFAYTGHPFERRSGLSLALFRAYDPRLGRWLSRDPLFDYGAETGRWTGNDSIGFSGEDLNLYAYADGDPIDLIDPEGTIVFAPIVAGFIFGAGLDIGIQLLQNGGDFGCINWGSALAAGAMGAAGGALGMLGKGVKGFEFSHALPRRWVGNAGGMLNGNYVPKAFHIATDPYRFRFVPRVLKPTTFRFPPGIAQVFRMPGWMAGGGVGAGVGAAARGGD